MSTPYGKRLIPQILDALAAAEPDRIIYTIARLSDSNTDFVHINAGTFAKAVDKTAWWLQGQTNNAQGQKTNTPQVVGYIGPHDIRHILLTYACVKAGCTVSKIYKSAMEPTFYRAHLFAQALFLSPKNSTDGAIAVLDAAKCSAWIKPREQPCLPLVEDFLQQRPMDVLELPEVEELLDAQSVEAFKYETTFDAAIDDPFCILHTSGSTGLPKPIPWSHGLIGTMDAVRLLPPTEGDDGLAPWTSLWKEGDRIYSSFPMSHVSIASLRTLGVYPNMNLVEALADHASIDIWSMVPSLVDELGETPDVLEKLRPSKFICASGGPVTPSSAGKVNDVVRVLNLTGTTEGLFIGNLVVEREDWLWFAFHPFSGFEFKELEPGVFEHWIHRNDKSSLFQGIFRTFPTHQSYNFKDLYVRHPTKPNLWSFSGRSDDIVVLSNGYKISPLDTEAFIGTHPAINGCLVIGTGKPQASLLVELKDPTVKNNELFDSIWSMVEKANTLSLHKNQLQKDYITFTEPDKAFIRTDKGTIKRHATLALFADYIERFYNSRGEDSDAVTVDTTSVESIAKSVRQILGSSLPAVHEALPDTDLFSIGLDSILVFRVVKAIRASMGLQDRLAPRHLYASPTLAKFSATLARLANEASKSNGEGATDAVDDDMTRMKAMIDQHKARLSFKMNPFDYVNPNHYMGLQFYFPLRKGVSFSQAFVGLQEGLRRVFQLCPALDGRMMVCSEQEIGYKKGDLRLSIPQIPSTISSAGDDSHSSKGPRQLTYKDVSQVLPSFEDMRAAGFAPSLFKDEVVLDENTFPKYPADILAAQANFVEGGCILATNFHHGCLDGIGAIIALKAWAESCKYAQGDKSATCSWFDPESFNHSLPEIIHEQEGYTRRPEDIDPKVWGFLPFLPPEKPLEAPNGRTTSTNGLGPPESKSLLPPPPFPHRFVWPPPPVEDGLSTTMFLIPPGKVKQLQKAALADSAAQGSVTSVSDIVQAFFWRAAIRARYRVATELRGEMFGPEEISVLELPVDARPYFSTLLPSTYMGSMLILNRVSMGIERLCSPATSIGQVARLLREAAARVTPSLVHDAFTLLQSLTGYDRFTTACMGVAGMHAMISNLMLFQLSEISFGNGFFDGEGSPAAMRPQVERGNRRFRFLMIYPMREDGGVELVLGTRSEELRMLKADAEFMQYAQLVDSC
ncbi:MAG: hypothetical protein Q9169_004783 [Polycauliona sp. 2 TL-2023]